MYAFSFCCAHVDNGDMMDRYQYLRDRYFIDRSPAHGNLENCGNGDSDVSSKTDPSHLSRLSHPFPIYFYFLQRARAQLLYSLIPPTDIYMRGNASASSDNADFGVKDKSDTIYGNGDFIPRASSHANQNDN